jgi:hypothetical protein
LIPSIRFLGTGCCFCIAPQKWLSVIRNAFWEMADAGDFGGSVLKGK